KGPGRGTAIAFDDTHTGVGALAWGEVFTAATHATTLNLVPAIACPQVQGQGFGEAVTDLAEYGVVLVFRQCRGVDIGGAKIQEVERLGAGTHAGGGFVIAVKSADDPFHPI